jgi:hypothetical protein
MTAMQQKLPMACDAKWADDIQSINIFLIIGLKVSWGYREDDTSIRKTHTPNFLSHELGTKTIAPNTSATKGFS